MSDLSIASVGQQPLFPYLNFEQGIRINYPAGWTKGEQPSPAGFIVFFASQREDLSDAFCENLNIFVERLPAGFSVDQYAQACFQGMAQAPIQFLEKTQITLDGRPAYRIVYTGPLQAPGIALSGKFLQYLLVSQSKGYVVTYTAQIQKFDKFLPLIQQMIDSLQIK